jgi:GT2 family glycosyltransferase
VELAVCVDPDGLGNPAVTYASLERQTVAAGEVMGIGLAQGLRESRAPWLMGISAGDRLAPVALERLGQAILLASDAAVLTADEDELGGEGERRDPRLLPGPSPDALLAGVRVGRPLAVAREAALAVGARPGPAWELELLLRLGGPDAGGHAHVPLVLVHRAARPAPDDQAEAAVVSELSGGSVGVEVTAPGRRRLRRQVGGEPSVEVIVCFRDRPHLIERCVGSVLERSSYPRLRLRLVDNASAEARTAEVVARLAGDDRVSVMQDPAPFNFAQLNNRAAAQSRADFLVLLNNDTQVLTPTWVEDLLEEAARPEVGAVAPLLVYPGGRVQHAGAVLGLHGYAGHPFAGCAPDQPTPFGRADEGARNWLAVSAACLMVERRKWDAVGGMDPAFAVGGNDVDLCLRLTEAGHRSLCLPHVRLVHEESASRDPMAVPEGDRARSRERYGAFRTLGDPFYNPGLTLAGTDCALRSPEELER